MKISPAERRILLEKLMAYLYALENQSVQILEQLCHDATRAWDRHCTLENRLCFGVERVGWQVSGGQICLWGAEQQYSLFSGHIATFELLQEGAEIVEYLSESCWRKTRIWVQPPQTGGV